ncbi:MAG: hypothetical protein KGQ81_04565 [Cyanobacteria bacterium REEB498]|jgi:hypothetical protein|nr:hypothetical protein [Cyanobacteria bacterium REEB498]
MPDTFALFLAIGIIGTSVALATAILFDDSRTKQRSIEHYRNLERQRAHRMRRLSGKGETRPSWDHYLDDKNQRAA